MTTKQYDAYSDLITFTRASTGTYLDSDGLLKTASTNVPRIEYDASGNRKGLLIEEARTNLVTAYAAPTDTSRVYVSNVSGGAGVASVVSDISALTESGLQTITNGNVYKLDNSSGTGDSFLAFLGGFDSNNITVSAFIRGTNGIRLRMGYGDYPQKPTSETSYTRVVTSSAEKTGGVYNASDVLWLRVPAGGVGYVCLPQAEVGSFPTSYIPTSGSTATRSADVASIPTSAFGYNQKAGTVVVEHQSVASINQRSASINDGTSNNAIQIVVSTSGGGSLVGEIRTNATGQMFQPSPIGITAGQNYKIAMAYAENDAAVSRDGTLGTDSSVVVPAVSNLVIGAGTSTFAFLNGHIKSIQYYPRRLTNAQLQRLTA